MKQNQVRLKHGDLDVSILICNRARVSAGAKFARDMGYSVETVAGKESGLSNVSLYFTYYAYYGYVAFENFVNNKEPEVSEFEFTEAISDLSVDDSNLADVYKQIGEAFVSTIKKQVEAANKEAAKKKKPPLKATTS